jgi:hypothetical protein
MGTRVCDQASRVWIAPKETPPKRGTKFRTTNLLLVLWACVSALLAALTWLVLSGGLVLLCRLLVRLAALLTAALAALVLLAALLLILIILIAHEELSFKV